MSVLIVVAHPDDEVLGCGATAAVLASRGIKVQSCFLSRKVDARQGRPEEDAFLAHVAEAQRILGLQKPILGNFPNIRFNTVDHLDLVQFIEAAIEQSGADTIFTNHPADLNDDHKHTSAACQAAARLFQRRPGLKPLKALYFMETLSATDWSFPTGSEFRADTFFEIGERHLDEKIRALEAYEGVMRPYPHPRSPEAIGGLAAYRGGQAGMRYAEAFQTGFCALGRF